MKVLLSGGSEFIREAISRELLARGHSIVSAESDAAIELREREFLVRQTIIRTSHVYGPGDELVTPLLKMIRALPAVPVHAGDEELQPIWCDDLARVLATTLERADLAKQTLEAAGPEITTMNDLFARLCEIAGRKPLRVPVPGSLELPRTGIDAIRILGVQTTPLDRALRILADALPEALPEEGVGAMLHKKFFAEIRGSRFRAAALMREFRDRVNELMPIDFAAEPGAPERIERGITLTGKLPLRGHFQVRVEVADANHVVFATLEGHPLAGIVEFTTSEEGDVVRFAIDVYDRAANWIDLIGVRTLGGPAQAANWRALVQRIIDASGGTSDGVQQQSEKLDEEEASRVEERVRRIVQERKRDESAARAAQ